MTYNKHFPYTSCARDYVQDMAEEAISNGYKPALDEDCGYLLINEMLVPNSFVALVANKLAGGVFEYGAVHSATDLFRAGFLATLDTQQRSVLMPVVMHLIDLGEFPFQIFGSKLEAA